jgi:hypothetical protein
MLVGCKCMRQLYSLVTGLFNAVFMFNLDGLLDFAFSSAVSSVYCQAGVIGLLLPIWLTCRISTRKVTEEQRQCLVDKLPSLSTQFLCVYSAFYTE